MDFWSISLRSTFGNYAKFGLPDFLEVSLRVCPSNNTARARPQSRLLSCLSPVPTSTSRSTKNYDSSTVPTSTYRYFSIYEEQLNDTVYRRERYGFTFYSDIVRELSTYRYSRLFSPEVFIVLTLLNSWFSSYSLARRIYYLIHASFLRRVYYFKMHRLVYSKSCFLVHQLIVLY